MPKRLRWSGSGTPGTVNGIKLDILYDPISGATLSSDWTNRSTYAGVVWAHDFRTAAECDNFLDTNPTTRTTVYNPNDGHTGGCVEINIPGNLPSSGITMTAINSTTVRVTTALDLQLTTADQVRFFNLTAPWNVANDAWDGGSGVIGSYQVKAVNSPTSFDYDPTNSSFNTLFNPTGFAPYTSGTATAQRCRVSLGTWNRPLSALSSGNGQTSADRGIATLGMPGRTWSPTWSVQRADRWRYDYYSHIDYSTPYLGSPGIANWYDWDGSLLSNNWRGSDYWVQWRIKISASRYQASNAAIRNQESLKCIGMWTTWRTPLHEVVWNDRNTIHFPYGNYPASAGGSVDGYTGASAAHGFQDGNAGGSMQPGGDYNSTCIWNGNFPTDPLSCFNVVPDMWYTFLLHVIPGKHVGSWTGWPVVPNAVDGTGIQLWACPQSRIDSMRAAGQAVTYLKIFDKVGALAYPFAYDNASGTIANSEPPPGWNSFLFWTYQNNLPQSFAWTRRLSQVIFKKGSGVLNQNYTTVNPHIDGIPCPQI